METKLISQNHHSCEIDTQELMAYKHPTAFNFFLYSRDESNTPLFMLLSEKESLKFSHFHGSVTARDPNIFFAIAREFVTITRGLLHSQNFNLFQANNSISFEPADIWVEEDLQGPIIPQKQFTRGADDICRLLCDCQLVFQDETDTTDYFIEIPLLDTQRIKEISQIKGISIDLKYFTLNEILKVQSLEIHKRLTLCFNNKKLLSYVKKYIVDSEPIEIKKHFAVISCDPVAKSSMLPSLHYSVYKKHGEHWRFYKAYEGELPNDEDLKKITGILIPGSSQNAYNTNMPYYKEILQFIIKIVNEYKHINFLGICYGAQIIAEALGGKTEKMRVPFIRGGDLLLVEPSFYTLEYIKTLKIDQFKSLVIGQAHGDHIIELPPGAICHASSENTKIEVYSIRSNVLAFQGHPEFNEAWTAGACFRMTKPNVEDYDKFAEEYIRETFPIPVAREELLKICYNFLKKEP